MGVDACMQETSKFKKLLTMMFIGKTTNVELENNFARSSASRSYLRGNRHSASTMALKHLVAELKHQHLLSLGHDSNAVKRLKKQVGLRLANGGIDSVGVELTEQCRKARCLMATPSLQISSDMVLKGNSIKKTKKTVTKDTKKVNGWNLFLQDSFRENQRPNESQKERYNRIRAAAKEAFRDPEVKSRYSVLARSENKKNDLKRREHLRNELCLMNLVNTDQYGPWGIGDEKFPLSKTHLEEVMQQPGFVKANSQKFKDFWQSSGGLKGPRALTVFKFQGCEETNHNPAQVVLFESLSLHSKWDGLQIIMIPM